MTEALERAEELFEQLDTDDVGQRRYLMFRAFDLVLEDVYESSDRELPEPSDRVSELEGFQGYIYKLSQEFLTTGSTLEKERKLEKMLEHLR